MKSPIPIVNTRNMIRDLGELNRKLIRGAEILTGIEKVDVGTAPMDLVYQEDKMKLYHYRREGEATCSIPVLIVYALVNRQYILDLQPDRSVIRKLLEHGLDIYIIDWDYPTKVDMYITMDDYINGYLHNCVEFIRKNTRNDKINLMGICQGGTFCAMYAAMNPEKIKNLLTLVAPFDFSPNDGLLFAWAKHMNADALVNNYRVVPGDFLNMGFLMLMPFTLNIRKYVDMVDIFEDEGKLLNFLRMEKWIFDSPGQVGECLREFIKDFYQENKLVKGEVKVGGREVNLKNITMPLLNIYASSDHLVPPSTTRPLNDLVGSTDKSLYEFEGGHIGVFVGSKSQRVLAPFIAKWLHERQDGEPVKKSGVSPEESIPPATPGKKLKRNRKS
ncbi:MAG TPA: class III poly(R)-hydroxyalkanoic acid synthase subunit PhaC [Dissulfurispiraceae bacterium]|nr:class III poly(R)-hydroxyalkanoic acid synthase subunit PhaC [Dissulfurispiraceae bacterium]